MVLKFFVVVDPSLWINLISLFFIHNSQCDLYQLNSHAEVWFLELNVCLRTIFRTQLVGYSRDCYYISKRFLIFLIRIRDKNKKSNLFQTSVSIQTGWTFKTSICECVMDIARIPNIQSKKGYDAEEINIILRMDSGTWTPLRPL